MRLGTIIVVRKRRGNSSVGEQRSKSCMKVGTSAAEAVVGGA